MNLNEIFPNGAEFMDWLANNCYSCEKLGDGITQDNPNCEFESIISYSDLTEEIDKNLTKIITENGKLCKCKNFVRATRKLLVFFTMLLVLTGCAAKNQKTYTNKIKFYKEKIQIVLYAGKKQKKIPDEYYKINFSEPLIAENKLKIHMLHRLNEYEKSFIPVAQKEIQKVQEFTAALKARISEMDNQRKQIEELKKQIKESNLKIKQLKPRKKNEPSRN